MVREGLRAVLEREPGITVVGEAGDGMAAVELAIRLAPDVVVMDIAMSTLNGIEATREMQRTCPDCKVVALSTYADKRYVQRMLEAGARGYVVKASAGQELLRAVQAVARGEGYLSSDITTSVIENTLSRGAWAAPALADREREVLQLLTEGKASKQVATLLNLSVRTVEAHRRNIMKKLDLHDLASLTKYAIREGITACDC